MIIWRIIVMPKVSIIVPVYNVEWYLKRCLESLVNQTLKDIEIILVNDASTDNSHKILEEYSTIHPEKVIVIDSKVNLRQGGARNLGLEIATGEFIGFVDSDDWVSTDMYELLYQKAVETGCDVVDCDYHVSDGDNVIDTITSNTPDQMGVHTDNTKKSLILNAGRMWTKIYKRDIFTLNDIKFPEHLFYEDNPVVPLLMVYSKHLEKVDKPLYFYFKNTSSTTRTKESYHHFDRLITSEILLDEFKQRGFYDTYRDEIEFRFMELYYINTIPICLAYFNKPEISYLSKIRKFMNHHLKGYRNNIYFKNVNTKSKVITMINDIHPRLLSFIFRFFMLLMPKIIKKI